MVRHRFRLPVAALLASLAAHCTSAGPAAVPPGAPATPEWPPKESGGTAAPPAAGAAAASGSAAAAAAGASAGEVRYAFILAGHRAGGAVERAGTPGEWSASFEFNDRGRGPNTAASAVLDRHGLPLRVLISGHGYFNNPVNERFDWVGGKASWKNAGEQGARDVAGRAFYVSQDGPPLELGLLARALLAARGGRLDLLPDGEARIAKEGKAEVQGPGFVRPVDLYALTGLGFNPQYVWLDGQQKLFAVVDGWTTLILEGWESAVPVLQKAQDRAVAARDKALAARLARHPGDRLVIRGARLFNSETLESQPGMTVVVAGNRIERVGRDREVQPPSGAEVVEANGKTLLPGLWDMHVHLTPSDGLLDLAAGVTSVRDMANDIDQLQDMRRRWDAGEALGPRVLMAGFIDGPGPYAGPSKVLASTEQEALAAVDRYAQLGYVQIKLYSSLDPKLVPPIVARAHQLGLRVSGHIPNGLTAEQAVREGFNEIQHVNFLFLNFLPGYDTRTPQRFTAVAEHAAEIDLASERVRDFLRLLHDRQIAVDPTVNIFESMFTDRPGEMSHGWAAVADRLPPQVRRGLTSGGLPVPPGLDERYRKSFQALLAMVRALHDQGITIEAGTDGAAGFSLHRELELYVEAGIPAPEVLRIATLGAARVVGRDKELGSIAPGKLADLILVDGDPAARIGDIRRVVLTVKDGVVYDPAELYKAIGVRPAG
ncbi:MAG TPA: amidohydrolase family protein [Thermoanaerobaculia bacterium]|nr:amidohydrolase family protein [Thermoanaerobaculia bacterium]